MRFVGQLVCCAILVLCGCRAHINSSTSSASFHEPTIAPTGHVRSYATYVAACEAAKDAYERLLRDRKDSPPVFVVRELGKLRSADARRYALALAETLKKHNVQVPPLDESTSETAASYDELAKVHALTCLIRGPGEPWENEVPEELWRDLLRVMVSNCPCDDATLYNVASLIFVWDKSCRNGGPSKAVRKDWNEIIRSSLARITDPRRKMNLTAVGPALSLHDAGEFIYVYLFTIDNPTSRELTDLYEKLEQARQRAARFPLPPDVRKADDEYTQLRKTQQKERDRQLREMDSRVSLLPDPTPALQPLFRALERRDPAVARTYLAPELLEKTADPVTLILGIGHDRLVPEYVAVAYGASGLVMHAVAQGKAGDEGMMLYLQKIDTPAQWQIRAIGRAETQ